MDEFMMYTLYLEGLNTIFLAGLLYIYIPNYKALKSLTGAGLILFSLVLLIQNLAGIFLHFTGGELYAKMLAVQVFGLKLIETIAILVLSYSAWKE